MRETICIYQINALAEQIHTHTHTDSEVPQIAATVERFLGGQERDKKRCDTETVEKFITKKGITKSHINLCIRFTMCVGLGVSVNVCVSVSVSQQQEENESQTEMRR